MILLSILQRACCLRAAVLGTVKNAGKTEALNTLVAEAALAGLGIGVTSSGRDGERVDALFRHQKPAICLSAGTLVLTYEGFDPRSAELLYPFRVLDRHPEYGRLVLARMRKEGEIQLAGPVTRSGISAGVELLADAGAQLVLVDGSIDRRGFIDPGIIGGIILSTGMALSPVVDEVAAKTAFWAEILRLALWNGELPTENAFYIDRWTPLEMGTALGYEYSLARCLPGGVKALYLRGALTGRLLQTLCGERKYPVIVIENPYSFLADTMAYRSFLRGGGEVRVRARSQLLAITVNPWGHGAGADPQRLAAAVKEWIPDLPVVDVRQKLVL